MIGNENEVYFTDAAGRGHRAVVVERGPKMTVIQYFDNTRRGIRHTAGRAYNHATRVRVRVWNAELRPAPDFS